LRLKQNPRSSVFIRVLISSVRSVKLPLGRENNPFPAGKDLIVSSTASGHAGRSPSSRGAGRWIFGCGWGALG